MYCCLRIKKTVCLLLAIGVLLLLPAALLMRPAAAVSEPDDAVSLPIIMYHSLLKDPARQGKYVISPDDFESDLRYLQENGYTTVVMQDVIDYVRDGKPLPEKPVVLTFDDGHYNNYSYAFPLLKAYNSRMVLSPVGAYTDQYSEPGERNANYSYLVWEDLRTMQESGYVELQNHTYAMHDAKGGRKGAARRRGESLEQYRQALTADLTRMQELTTAHTGFTPTTFTYPFGAISEESVPILKELGFAATLTCEYRINRLTHDPDCLYGLGRYLRPAGVDSAAFFSAILG